MRRETENIIGDLVDTMDYSIAVNSIVDNNDGTYTINVCDTLHLQNKYELTIDAVVYTILSVVNNTSITVSGSVMPNTETITAYKPKYYFGTVITTNIELTKKQKANDKMPMVYLRTEFEDVFFSRNEAFDRKTDLEIFFLTQNDFKKTEEKIRIDGVLPMRNLAYKFVEYLQSHKEIGIIEDYKIKNWTRFGVESTNGQTKTIFDGHISGCQLSITIPFRKGNLCCN